MKIESCAKRCLYMGQLSRLPLLPGVVLGLQQRPLELWAVGLQKEAGSKAVESRKPASGGPREIRNRHDQPGPAKRKMRVEDFRLNWAEEGLKRG